MKRKTIITIIVAVLVLFLAWAPWITDEYAIDRVTERLGGPTASFWYLGEDMAIKDIPKYVLWLPFGRAVYLPSEAVWLVTFYGGVIF